jgi:hypothetical protein
VYMRRIIYETKVRISELIYDYETYNESLQ